MWWQGHEAVKFHFSPGAWLLFGFLGFPIICVGAEMMGLVALAVLHWLPKTGVPEFGWGGGPGLFLGGPLGVVSALSAMGWRNERFVPARCMALLGGISIGGWWLRWLAPMPLVGWIGDFGFAVPPLLWALSLVTFALFARPPRA